LKISKTIKVCCLVETTKVICSLHFEDFNVFCQDYHSLLSCRDNQGHLLLYFSKTIRVFGLAETVKVICSFTFQKLSESFVVQRLSMSSSFYLSKTIRVFCLQEYQVCWLVKTIKVICLFTFQRLQCLLSRLSQSSLHFQDYQSLLSRKDNQVHLLSLHFKDFNVFRQDYHSLLYISKTIRVFCFKDYHSLLYFSKTIKVYCLVETIDVFRSLHFQRPSESFVSRTIRVFCRDFNVSFTFQNSKVFCLMYLIPFTLLLLTGFTTWVSASGRSDGDITRMKLVSLSLLTFYFSIKR